MRYLRVISGRVIKVPSKSGTLFYKESIMADTPITRITLGHNVDQKQVIGPNYQYGQVALADALYHAMVVDGRGKGRMTVYVTNETNKDVVVTVYGSQTADGDPADAEVIELGGSGESQFTVTAGSKDYETYNDPFPWYIIRIKAATSPNGEAVTIYANLMAY
jgi:hypothetical protein